jgi:hypothetical protein
MAMFNKLLDPGGSKLPRLSELGPQIGAEVERLETLTVVQLATEVMTKAFKPDYTPGSGIQELGGIKDYFLPDYGPERAGDTTPEQELALEDLLAEGVQLLEHARLVRPKFGYSGNVACSGWITTRPGRSALAAARAMSAPASLSKAPRHRRWP